jgi:hypothetical protein
MLRHAFALLSLTLSITAWTAGDGNAPPADAVPEIFTKTGTHFHAEFMHANTL